MVLSVGLEPTRPKASGPKPGASAYFAKRAMYIWCTREDSNLHPLTRTSTSSLRGYQLRHGCKTHYLCLIITNLTAFGYYETQFYLADDRGLDPQPVSEPSCFRNSAVSLNSLSSLILVPRAGVEPAKTRILSASAVPIYLVTRGKIHGAPRGTRTLKSSVFETVSCSDLLKPSGRGGVARNRT